MIYTSFCRYILSEDHITATPVAMRHMWFDHTKLGNAEAACSHPDLSLVVLNVLLEG
jgi:hypothetical protein